MSANWNSSGSSSSRSTRSTFQNSSNAAKVTSQVSCVICSEGYKSADNIYAGTCGHVFHWACLQRWWEESKKCPICRSTNADYFQIYLDFEESTSSPDRSHSRRSNAGEEANQYENLLYEAELYRDEIEYLNTRIRHLKLMFDDSD